MTKFPTIVVKLVTQRYSTSFTLGTKMLGSKFRKHIYNIYGFVRFADEIVDSFHNFNKEDLLQRFELDLTHALNEKISLNPILNSFQNTVHENNIQKDLIDAFLKSMKMDLHKHTYNTRRISRVHLRFCRCCWFNVSCRICRG